MLDKLDLQMFGEMEDAAADKIDETAKDYPYAGQEICRDLVLVARLMEINDTLGCISNSLERIADELEALEGCVSKTSRGSFFCITGNVANYEG